MPSIIIADFVRNSFNGFNAADPNFGDICDIIGSCATIIQWLYIDVKYSLIILIF